MKTEQQGLYLLDVMCTLISLLCSCFLLLICAMTQLWKTTSIRFVMYLTLGNIVTGLILLIPTYKYSFMCPFQEHVLHFALFSEVIWGALFLHYAYMKIVLEQKFTRVIEVRYLAIALIPSLLFSLPPFVPQELGTNCWDGTHTPLETVVSSYGFLVLYTLSALCSFSFIVGIYYYFKLFEKGYYTEEYERKYRKIRLIGRYSLVIYLTAFILYIYGILNMIGRHKRALDFISLMFHALCGLFTITLFLSSTKVQRKMSEYFKTQAVIAEILPEDSANFTSMTPELYSGLSD